MATDRPPGPGIEGHHAPCELHATLLCTDLLAFASKDRITELERSRSERDSSSRGTRYEADIIATPKGKLRPRDTHRDCPNAIANTSKAKCLRREAMHRQEQHTGSGSPQCAGTPPPAHTDLGFASRECAGSEGTAAHTRQSTAKTHADLAALRGTGRALRSPAPGRGLS